MTMRLLLFNLATDVDDPILGFTTRWIHALAQRTASIDVITMRAGRLEVPDNVQVYSVGKELGYSEPCRAVAFYRHLFKIMRQHHIDICFSHMIPIFSTLAAPILKAKGIPLVTWYAHPSLTLTLKLAHYLSNRMVTSVATAYPYRRDKATVVGQGIDISLFTPEQSALPEAPPLILCVGRLSPVKDHPTLLRALHLLRQRWPEPFRAVVLGGPTGVQDEPYVRSLHEQTRTLGLQDIVSFEPPVPIAALLSWYERCSILVNMTPTGSGDKVVWEAMACGRPALAANRGFAETFGEDADRLLFRYGDAADLAERLHWLFSLQESEQLRIRSLLRAQTIRLHSLEGLANRLIDLFQRELGDSPQPRSASRTGATHLEPTKN
jgi:glycosyltransferase involved in cell wall biosynthesis